MKNQKPLKVVTIGGGSGQFTLLSGLRDIKNIHITSVVSMVDSGGSTGRLRDELGVLPPGDILKCIVALSHDRDAIRRLLLTRFQINPRLRGHNAGNLLLSFMTRFAGDFPSGVAGLAEITGAAGDILPVTVDRATLVAELDDGSRIFGEAAIDVPTGRRAAIKRTYLVPHHSDQVRVFPPVLKAIRNADILVIGPGDLFTSIIPNLIVPGVAEAVRKSRARLVYNLNIMTKFGETNRFSAADFIREVEHHTGRRVDDVMLNAKRPTAKALARYAREGSEFVELLNKNELAPRRVHLVNLLEEDGTLIRHSALRLAKALESKIFWSRRK